jgi:hypothetical protein
MYIYLLYAVVLVRRKFLCSYCGNVRNVCVYYALVVVFVVSLET